VTPKPRPLSGRAPRVATPPGACDTHIHFYDFKRFPARPGTPTPPDASVEDYRKFQAWLGLERAVVVQANAYGDNNTLAIDAVAALGGERARAVVVVRPGVAETELDRLSNAGARAVRFMALLGGTLSWDQMDEVAARVHPFGWHALVQLDGRELAEREAQIRRLPCPFVIDHIGKFLEPVGTDHPGFKALLRLLETGRCWVKIAAAYETSKKGGPDYADVAPLARALIRAAPERMIWASNWPHAQADKVGYPDDVGWLDLLGDWAGDETTRRKILVDNPARLYGF
jgi:D-galactarolactone isomerase